MECPLSILAHRVHDGEASPDEAARFAAHVATCDACRREAELVRWAGDAVRVARRPGPTLGMVERWANGTALAEDRRARRLAGWLTAAAAAVLVGLAAVQLARPAADGSAAAVAASVEWDAASTLALASAADEQVPETLLAARWMAADLGAADDAAAGGRR